MDKENIAMKWDFTQTRELASIFILLGALVALMVAGSLSGGHFFEMWRQIFSQAHLAQLSPEETEGLAILFFNNVFFILIPIFLMVLVGGIVASLIQTKGMKVLPRAVILEFGRLHPAHGLRRIFSLASLLTIFRSLSSLAVILLVAFIVIKSRFIDAFPVAGMSVGQIFAFICGTAMEILVKALLALAVVASIGLIIRKEFYKNKFRKGPVSWQETVEAMRYADAVVSDAGKICITLRYDESRVAPYVVAKGKDLFARRILELARQNQVSIVEDKYLANELYSTVDVGQSVSSGYYKNIAEILANVYRFKNKITV